MDLSESEDDLPIRAKKPNFIDLLSSEEESSDTDLDKWLDEFDDW